MWYCQFKKEFDVEKFSAAQMLKGTTPSNCTTVNFGHSEFPRSEISPGNEKVA